MTVVSIAVVQTTKPVRLGAELQGAVIGILSLAKGWTAQVVATHEEVGTAEETVESAFRMSVGRMGGISEIPDTGVLFVHGVRDEDIPWVSAVRFEKAQ